MFDPAIRDVIRDGTRRSAAVVVPMLRSLFEPRTVVDVGGGEGWWAVEFVPDATVYSVDEMIPYPPAGGVKHLARNLNDPETLAHLIDTTGRCDLALCLEVAEHLIPAAAMPLVNALCTLAPVVAFSAAVPGQGGHGHLNEQWPGYWAHIFEQHDYRVSGALRWQLWGRPDVEPWYQQNLLIAAADDYDEQRPDFDWSSVNEVLYGPGADPIAVVHPITFAHHRGVPAP